MTIGSVPIADPNSAAVARPPAYALGQQEGLLFYVAEVDVYRPGGASAMVGAVLASGPIGEPPPAATVVSDYDTLRVSDLGYASLSGDIAGTRAYPPALETGLAVDRLTDLSIAGSGAAFSRGNLRIAFDGSGTITTAGRNVDGRAVRVLAGRKTYDRARGLWVSPSYATLAEVFTGLASTWQPDDTGVAIPVRDATLWLERVLQQTAYLGTGTTEGTTDMVGQAKPKLRGGSVAFPVKNIAPVLIDPVANVWQYNDGPGAIVALYEDGDAHFAFASNTTSLWTGTTPAGQYRTDDSRGLFQLGSPKAGRITADATGSFPFAGLKSTAAQIARYLMTEDMALDTRSIDLDSFTALDTLCPYEAGWYWDGRDTTAGVDAVGLFLAAVGARLVPTRAGRLRAMLLQAPPAGTVPRATYTTDHIVTVKRGPLPAEVGTPPYRLRWGYQHNHTVMDSDINSVVTDTRRQFLRAADRFQGWASAAVLAAVLRPSDPAPVVSALLDPADALAVVNRMGALWGEQRRLFNVELPMVLGLQHEVGDAVVIAFPTEGLDAGALGTVVGEQLRGGDETTILQVLI